MITLLLKLLLAHFAGDFLLQPNKWVADKMQRKSASPYLYLHTAVHAVRLLIVLQFDMHYWLGMLIIVISHFFIDLIKLKLHGKWQERYLFFADQLLHLLVILGVTLMYTNPEIHHQELYTPKAILFFTCTLFVTYVTAIIMRIVMDHWKLKDDSAEDSLQQAGKYIGMIERMLVFVFVILGQWSAIGFLIAAKSILRFSDLSRAKDRKLTEYIIIGTLLSISFAIATGLMYKHLQPLLPIE